MEKKIRTELLKMSGIMVVLVGLGIYAHEFVIAGIKAKMALNLSIFAIFGVAAGISFRHVLSLKNEVVALKALQVDYGAKSRRPTDPLSKPAIVFHEPELLGQGYRLIAEELGKQDDLEISNSTVQTLLHDVDQRINDRKSTILYFSGLMVFLGLLGAFMGLMKTVHSVSELIGAMDVSGKGGSDSFGKMIEGMKAPLNGMSVGFSSSLFGLMTSMVLGALERCMTSALKTLRNEFEHWLSNLAALEGTQEQSSGRPSHEFAAVRKVLEAGANQIGELRGAVQDAIRSAGQTRSDLDRLAGVVGELTSAVRQLADPRPILQPVSDALCDLTQNQSNLIAQFQSVQVEAAVDRSQIRASLDTIGKLVEQSRQLDGSELHRQLDRLITAQREVADREPIVIQATTTQPLPTRGLWSALSAKFGSGDKANVRGIQEARALRKDVRDGLSDTRRAVRGLTDRIDERLIALESAAELDREALARLDIHTRRQQEALEQLNDQFAPTESVDAAAPVGARRGLELLRRRLGLITEENQVDENAGELLRRKNGTND